MEKTPRLPLELIIEIFSNLDNDSAANALLACRAVYDLCQHTWYRSVDLSVSCTRIAPEKISAQFLRTISRRPELGKLVRELAVGCTNRIPGISVVRTIQRGAPTAETKFLNTIEEDGSDESLTMVPFPRLMLPDVPIFRPVLEYSGELYRLLELLPNLRTFDLLEGGFMRDSLTFAALGLTTNGIPAGLRDLHTLHLHFGRSSPSELKHFSGQDIVPLFSLPALRSLTVERLVDCGPTRRWEGFIKEKLRDQGMSPINHLALVECDIAPSLLSAILVLPRELHTLQYDMVPDPRQLHGFDWDAFSAAIYTHSATLTMLNVSNLSLDEFSTESGSIVGVLQSLRDFAVLQHLRLPARALLGPVRDESSLDCCYPLSFSPLLPTSLITLDLRLNWPWDLRSFMERTSCPELWWIEKANLPNLTQFVLRRVGGDDLACRAGDNLIKAFAESGIIVEPPLGDPSQIGRKRDRRSDLLAVSPTSSFEGFTRD